MSNNLAATCESIATFAMEYNALVQYQRAMTPEPLPLTRTVDNATSPLPNFGPSIRVRPSKHISRNRTQKRTATTMIWCNYCRNQMPESSMQAHLERKHKHTADNHGPKRSHADQMPQLFSKRQRLDNDPAMENGSMTPPFDGFRPETPPMPVQPQQPVTFVQIEGMPYNLVYVSDCELNKLMENGLIRVHNGHIFMKDTEQNCSDLDCSLEFAEDEIKEL